MGFTCGASSKEPTCQCRRHKRRRFDSWVRKIPWWRACNPLQYSCLENPMDRGAWWAMVHRVTKSRTRLKQLSMHAGAHLLGQVGGPGQARGINSRAHSWGRQTGCGLWTVSMGWSQKRDGHFLGVGENQLFCPVVMRKMSDLAHFQNYSILLSLTKIRI